MERCECKQTCDGGSTVRFVRYSSLKTGMPGCLASCDWTAREHGSEVFAILCERTVVTFVRADSLHMERCERKQTCERVYTVSYVRADLWHADRNGCLATLVEDTRTWLKARARGRETTWGDSALATEQHAGSPFANPRPQLPRAAAGDAASEHSRRRRQRLRSHGLEGRVPIGMSRDEALNRCNKVSARVWARVLFFADRMRDVTFVRVWWFLKLCREN
jgi:hypothetical protein